ncbi:MAG: CRISPR-associated endonuclease Cas1 [Nitrososphaerota archaeon]
MSELVIEKAGCYIGVRRGMFYVRSADGSRYEIPPVKLSHISVRSRGVSISGDAVVLACRFGVEITVYHKGRPVSKVVHAVKGGGVLTRHAQLDASRSDKGLAVAKAIVAAKLHNQRQVVYQRGRELLARGRAVGRELVTLADGIQRAMDSLAGVKSVDQVRAYEAQGASNYWRAVSLILPDELGFQGRTAWSPSDPFNKALNIGYGVLRSRVWSAVLSANLDPYIGFLHLPRGRHMCLVSDLMEEFRPGVVDRPLIALALDKYTVLMDESSMEKAVVSAVGQALQRDDRRFEKAIFEQSRRLASYLRGALDVYMGFRLRW